MATYPTNQRLRQLLLELGFEAKSVTPKSNTVFAHPGSGCTILLPLNKLDEHSRPADLLGMKSQLIDQGHLNDDDFEHYLREGKLPESPEPRVQSQ